MIQAGRLRWPVIIEGQSFEQNADGQMSPAFVALYELADDVRAEIIPLSGREYVTAREIAAEITTRITIRYLPDIEPTMRIKRPIDYTAPQMRFEVYDILAVLPDPVSGHRYLTLMCVQRFAEGFRRGE